MIIISLSLLLVFSARFVLVVISGSAEDKTDTLPLHGDAGEDVGELQSKPRHTGKVQQIPHLDPPVCLPAVLIDLEVNPLSGLDPWAQHKKQFKAAKDASKKGQGMSVVAKMQKCFTSLFACRRCDFECVAAGDAGDVLEAWTSKI